ncbi:Thiol-disulfide isomerase or thioredoxin [Sphingobacterium nematocida]|uniref:Thiol-disulfide isomerase or thioredoxin n=1 Tax=Sphingobacterium nematocida TaxID=1513896 RepID=A0A1T5FZD2_9SPHI|nr:TlpA disulfide reductase family protein [Sphingobacterium nematocida]SKC01467.1 Thiol-disulfide isomerase or thioredoxin [Sphingobacterium nematocida]
MKYILITFLLILLCRQVDAQYQALKIGDKVPDFEFQIKNYKAPTARMSDFKGKLVFFDFWSTYCSSCIAGFPKMEKLQQEFGDKIIVILVNMRETQEEVNNRLKARKSTAPELSRMPSIIDEQAFAQLFPHRYAGNYVWIGPDGKLRLNSYIPYNIHPKKIREVLAGKEITFLAPGEQYGLTERAPSLLNIVNDSNPNNLDIYSLLCPVNLDYYPMGGQKLNQRDTILNTVRNTFINGGVAELYNYALQGNLNDDWKSNVYGPNPNVYHNINRFRFLVKDTSKYDNRLISKDKRTDEYVTRSLYCYEQVLPQTVTTEQALGYMKEDLDRYFGIRYGSKVTIEEREIPCYYLKKTNNAAKLSEDEIKKKLRDLKYKEFTNTWSYNSLMSSYFRAIGDYPYIFLDADTPIKFSALVPRDDEWKKESNLEDFQQVLELNNLKLVKGTKKINMIVVRD